MLGPRSLSLSQLRAGSSTSDSPPAVHFLSPPPSFRAVVTVQLGPELQPTGPRVSATCSGPSLFSPPHAAGPSPAHQIRSPRDYGVLLNFARVTLTWERATSASRYRHGPQILAPVFAYCGPRLPYSGSGGGASGDLPMGRGGAGACPGGGAPGPSRTSLVLPERSAVAIATCGRWMPKVDILLAESGHLSPSLLLRWRQWRAITAPPPCSVTLSKSSRSFYFFNMQLH